MYLYLRVRAYRRAFKVPVRKVARLVTRGVVLLPVRENGHITADQYMARETQVEQCFISAKLLTHATLFIIVIIFFSLSQTNHCWSV